MSEKFSQADIELNLQTLLSGEAADCLSSPAPERTDRSALAASLLEKNFISASHVVIYSWLYCQLGFVIIDWGA